jgi:hypothetical protein
MRLPQHPCLAFLLGVVLFLAARGGHADIVEDFAVTASQIIDTQDLAETPQRTLAPPNGTGFLWGAYAKPTGTSKIRLEPVLETTVLRFAEFVKTPGNYAYTIFANDGTNQATTSVDMSGPSAAIAIDVYNNPTSGAVRFMIRAGPGAWFLADTALSLTSGSGPYTQSLSGMTWKSVTATGAGGSLDALAGGDEANLDIGAPDTPDLSAVDGGGIYIDQEIMADTTRFRVESIAWIGLVSNAAPKVDVGPDRELPVWDSLALAATVNDDGLPDPPGALSLVWSKADGPGAVTFGDASAANTTATFATAGSYVLRLTADDGDQSANAELAVTVHPIGPWPLDTGFEAPEYQPGGLNAQNGWSADAGGAVQTTIVGAGDQAVELPSGAAATYGVVNNTDSVVWFEVSCDAVVIDTGQEMPSAAGRLPAPQGLSCALLFDPVNGIICLDGDGSGYGQWRSTGLLPGAWTTIKIRQDYQAHRWRLYADGQLVLSNLGNAWNTSNLTKLRCQSGAGGPLYLDDARAGFAPSRVEWWVSY